MRLKPLLEKFPVDKKEPNVGEFNLPNKEIESFQNEYGGISLNSGMYRIHSKESSKYWTKNIFESFPNYANKVVVFGFDWMGRQFSINFSNTRVNLFDIATGEDLELGIDLESFHNDEIVNHYEGLFDTSRFNDWIKNHRGLEFKECIGFKIPLYLGGEDATENYEISDMDVYWEINKQLKDKVK